MNESRLRSLLHSPRTTLGSAFSRLGEPHRYGIPAVTLCLQVVVDLDGLPRCPLHFLDEARILLSALHDLVVEFGEVLILRVLTKNKRCNQHLDHHTTRGFEFLQ